MGTTVIQTLNLILTDGTYIFHTTASGDFYWLTQGVVVAETVSQAIFGDFANFSVRIDGQVQGDSDAINGRRHRRIGCGSVNERNWHQHRRRA